MGWTVTPNADSFLDAAGDFLRATPVETTVLLTEAAYLAGRPTSAPDQRHGWWPASGPTVRGAFLQAPRHPPILSRMPLAALPSLVDVLAGEPALGVDGRMVDDVIAVWRERTGVALVERSRIRLYRLAEVAESVPTTDRPGRARVATRADRDLLVSWFGMLMAEYPDDPSDLSYVVDEPIDDGGMLLWEVDGTPRAMAGRSRVIAGMTRLGPVWSPTGGAVDAHTRAALAAACQAAARVADHVLIFAGSTDITARAQYTALGFTPVLDRVTLARA